MNKAVGFDELTITLIGPSLRNLDCALPRPVSLHFCSLGIGGLDFQKQHTDLVWLYASSRFVFGFFW